MRNQHARKKKAGQNKSKKVQAMRKSEEARKAQAAAPPKHEKDKGSLLKFAPGGADERFSNYSRGRSR